MNEFFQYPNRNESIRRYTAILAWMFSSVKLVRGSGANEKTIYVPCMVTGEMAYHRSARSRREEVIQYRTSIPRSGVTFRGIHLDTLRLTSPQQKLSLSRQEAAKLNLQGTRSQDSRTSMTFNFDVTFKVGTRSEAYQLIELVTARFNPSVSLEVMDSKDIAIRQAIHVDLLDTVYEDDWEGDFDETRDILVTFSLAVKGYMYNPTTETGLIEKVICSLDMDNHIDPEWIVTEG